MYYKKLISNETIIEFHNDWLGVETITANGCQVSRGTSVWGMNHYFSIIEKGRNVRYVLTTKVTAGMQIAVDLSRNGVPIYENEIVGMGGKPKKPQNKAKKDGLKLLQQYDLENALDTFEKALSMNKKDPEIHFHMACAYSILERTEEGYESLKKAVAYDLQNRDMIFNHDMLAYLRIQDAFEEFAASEFKTYNIELLKEEMILA